MIVTMIMIMIVAMPSMTMSVSVTVYMRILRIISMCVCHNLAFFIVYNKDRIITMQSYDKEDAQAVQKQVTFQLQRGQRPVMMQFMPSGSNPSGRFTSGRGLPSRQMVRPHLRQWKCMWPSLGSW